MLLSITCPADRVSAPRNPPPGGRSLPSPGTATTFPPDRGRWDGQGQRHDASDQLRRRPVGEALAFARLVEQPPPGGAQLVGAHAAPPPSTSTAIRLRSSSVRP